MVHRMSFGAKFLAFQVCLIGISATLHAAHPGAQRSDPPAHLHENSGEFAGKNFRMTCGGTYTKNGELHFIEQSDTFILKEERACTSFPCKFLTPENQGGYDLTLSLIFYPDNPYKWTHDLKDLPDLGEVEYQGPHFSGVEFSSDPRKTPVEIKSQAERYLNDPAIDHSQLLMQDSVFQPIDAYKTLEIAADIPVKSGTQVSVKYTLSDGRTFIAQDPSTEAGLEQIKQRLTPEEVRAILDTQTA